MEIGTEKRDSFGRTALHYAALEGELALTRRLLSDGADANARDESGWTPLHFAAQAWQPELALALIEAGAEFDTPDIYGNTPLSTAVFNSRGRGELIEILRSAGADPRRENSAGQTPVGLARLIANFDVRQYFRDCP